MVQTTFDVGDAGSLAAVLADIGSGANSAINTAYTITLTAALSAPSESVTLASGSSVTLAGPYSLSVDSFAVTGTVIADLSFTGTITLNDGLFDNTAQTLNGGGTTVAVVYTGAIQGTIADGGDIVVNDGTIAGSGSIAPIELYAGTVQNGWGGPGSAQIAGVGGGVQFSGPGVGIVQNGGSIIASGTPSAAIVFLGSGTVENGQIGATGALISGGLNGVEIVGTGEVSNFGTIVGVASDAVSLGSGTVTNLGTIQTAAASGRGVDLVAGGTIVNGDSQGSAATISGVFNGMRVSGGAAGVGASVLNNGTIAGAVGVDFQTGPIAAAGTLTNNGLIASTSGAGGDAVVFGAGAETLVLRSGGRFIGDVLGNNAAGSSTTLELAAGTQGTLSGLGNDSGTVTDGAGTFSFSAFGTIALDAGATWNVTSPGTLDNVQNAGTLNVSGAAVTVSGSLSNAGAIAISSGALTAAAGVLADQGGITVGAGALLQANGAGIAAAGTSDIMVNSGSGAFATLSVTGGGATVNTNGYRMTVGSAGQGIMLVQSGGTVQSGTRFAADGAIDIGAGAAGNGTVTVTDTGSSVVASGQINVGVLGAGTLTVQNQATVFSGGSTLAPSQGIDAGQASGAHGDITVSGTKSLLSNAGQFIIGDGGLGTLAINGGGTVTTTPGSVAGLAGAVIANTPGASGSAVNVSGNVSGNSSNWQVGGALVVGNAGFGVLSVTQAGSVTATSLDEGATVPGNGVISVADPGSALIIDGLLTVGDQSSGGLSILGGGLVTALNANLGLTPTGSGNIDIEGAGSTLRIGTKINNVVTGGDLNVGVAGGGVITVGVGATLTATHAIVIGGLSTLNNLGGTVDPDTIVNTSANGSSALGLTQAGVYIANESTYVTNGGTGTIDTPLVQTGTDAVDAQANVDNGILGIWQIGSLGVLVMNTNTVDAGQVVLFGNKTAELVIGQDVTGGPGVDPVVQPGAANVLPNFHAQLWGYVAGNQILFSNLTVASDSVSGNTVTLFDGGHNVLGSLSFFNKFGAASTTAATAAAAQIVPCYAAGTRIETVSGPRAVETLRVGDEVRTVLGGPGRIVWVGSRTVDCARHPRPETVWPVRIAKGAFGPGLPVRDLLVSPDHAIYVDEVLIPAKLLINGTSIRQVKRRLVAYHHIELARHDVVLAEGLPAETYLDVGDRARFSGGAVTALHPDFAARAWEMEGCAPMVVAGLKLRMARVNLAARAGIPGRWAATLVRHTRLVAA